MAHFSILVIGDNPEQQLAIYDEKLEVETHKTYLTDQDIDLLVRQVEINPTDPDAVIEQLQDWSGFEGGMDNTGYYVWTISNPRGKWNWYIEGGRWAGYLKLKHGAHGELGKPAQKRVLLDQPLLYGDLSADVALMGDIDWHGIRQARRVEAERLWMEYDRRYGLPDEHHLGMEFAIEPDMDEARFIDVRSHPATFAVVENSDWHARGPTGWWGVLLDATPVGDWHDTFDSILSHVKPETLITVVDAHV